MQAIHIVLHRWCDQTEIHSVYSSRECARKAVACLYRTRCDNGRRRYGRGDFEIQAYGVVFTPVNGPCCRAASFKS